MAIRHSRHQRSALASPNPHDYRQSRAPDQLWMASIGGPLGSTLLSEAVTSLDVFLLIHVGILKLGHTLQQVLALET